MDRYAGHCPLHPMPEDCVCGRSPSALDIAMAGAIGMGMWRCPNSHVEVGPPVLGISNTTCARCSERLEFVNSGIYVPRGDQE